MGVIGYIRWIFNRGGGASPNAAELRSIDQGGSAGGSE